MNIASGKEATNSESPDVAQVDPVYSILPP